MIERELAAKLIEQITQHTEYNINIMDESGIIIASRDSKRVGTYHAVAERIIHGPQDTIVIHDEKEFPGVKPGINMAIMHEGRKEGVVGVTGDPERIRDVAMITRMAMEAMLRYEKQQESIRLRKSKKEHFLTLLTQQEFADSKEIRTVARQLEYDESLVRVPILCRLRNRQKPSGNADGSGSVPDPSAALEALRRGKGHWLQDFSFVMDDTHILVFKTVKTGGKHGFTTYREEIREYLESIRKWLRGYGTEAIFFVGSFQNNFTRYYYAFRHCKWLESHVQDPDEIEYFMDYVKEYFRSLIQEKELQQIFVVYKQMMGPSTCEQYTEMMKALEATNYNLSEAAKKLYIHKNTLIYRFNKMKDLLGTDPINSSMDRAFMEYLYMYLAFDK